MLEALRQSLGIGPPPKPLSRQAARAPSADSIDPKRRSRLRAVARRRRAGLS
jgi:hypothetical protein